MGPGGLWLLPGMDQPGLKLRGQDVDMAPPHPHATGPKDAGSRGAETLPVSRQGLRTQEAAKPEV